MVLSFASDDAESVVVEVLINLDFGYTIGSSGGEPAFIDVVVNHDGGMSHHNGLLHTARRTTGNNKTKSLSILSTKNRLNHFST